MPSARRTVVIRRPIGDVFAYVTDGRNGPRWRSGVLDVERVSGDGVGTRYRQGVTGPGGRRVDADYEVTAFEPNRRMEFKATAGPVRPTGGFAFDEVPEGTAVTFWLDEPLGGWKSLVFGGSVQRTMDAEMKALDRLKEILEAGG